jgi:uncharacterized protein
LADALVRIGEYVADYGLAGHGPYQAARDLPTALAAAVRLAPHLDGVFPIQGPPGAGKTHIGARMICALTHAGKRVGITANGHKVIRNVLDEVLEAAPELGASVA